MVATPRHETSTLLETEHLASLGRLAAKFGHAKPETIEEIRVSRVTLSEIELEVLSCEATSCVSLSLPIAFPRACSLDEDFSACVIDNVRSLEAMCPEDVGEKETHTSARFVTHFEAEGKPEWWSEAADDALRCACGDARDVLNAHDFHEDLVAFVSRLTAEDARAARVEHCGPAGLVIAASTAFSDRRVVHFRFPELSTTPTQLRQALLAAVATPPPAAPEEVVGGTFRAVEGELDAAFVAKHPLVAHLFGGLFSFDLDDVMRLRLDDRLLTLPFDQVTPATLRGSDATLRLVREDSGTLLLDLRLPEDRYMVSVSLDSLRLQVFPQTDASTVLTRSLARAPAHEASY